MVKPHNIFFLNKSQMNYMVTILTEHVEENVAAIQIFRYACKSFSIERIFFQKKKRFKLRTTRKYE